MSKANWVKMRIAGVILFITLVSPAWASDPNTVATPVFTPDGGTYNTEQNVIITCATPGATIRYTLDSSDPNVGMIYESNSIIFIDHSLTLKAVARKDGFNYSAKSATYQLVVSTPAFNPNGGCLFSEPNAPITITCETPGAEIHYTINGLNPNQSDPVIASGSNLIIDHDLTLKAAAWKENFNPSGVRSAFYQLQPVPIASKTDLMAMASNTTNYNKYFILTANIDMQGQIFSTAIIAPDTSSSTDFQGTAFTGILDGNGYKITHFTITGSSNSDYLGLFGYIGSGSMIKNLGLEDCVLSGSSGYYSTSYAVGSLAGENWGGNIVNCYSTATISGSCYSVGGLVGENNGTLTECYATGSISGKSFIGGLVGWNYYGTMTKCYATGSVNGSDYYAGGLAGNNDGNINNCYATTTVSGSSDVGGLVGDESGSISNCYSTGSVSGSSNVGGLVGYRYASTISNSFWDTQTSGQTTSAGGTGKTTDQMKKLSTFTSAGWDFTNETANGTNDIWRMCVNDVDYPRLNWKSIDGDFACPDGVNIEDLNYFVGRWLMNNCTSTNNYCGGVDMDSSGNVNLADWTVFAEHWREEI